MAANNASRGGAGFLTLLGLLFIGLKLTGFGLITSQIDTAPKPLAHNPHCKGRSKLTGAML